MIGLAHRRWWQRTLMTAVAVGSLVATAHARSHSWRSERADATWAVEVRVPAVAVSATPPPLAVYLRGLATERVGTESDAVLIDALTTAGCLVAVIDFENHPSTRVPELHRVLGELRDALDTRSLLSDQRFDGGRVYLVPAGCRLRRDVIYLHDARRTLALDIIHPAHPSGQQLGAVLEFSCDNRDRFGNASLSICSDTLLDGFAAAGWIVAMADHPVAPPYKGLDPMPASAQRIKAAVRTLRAEMAALGGSGAIVPVGFSRGSGMALMLATTAGRAEFEGIGEHPGVLSDVQGAVVLSGRFTYLDLLPDDPMIPRYEKAWGTRDAAAAVWREHGALDHLRPPIVPLFLSINATEAPEALHQMRVLRERLTAAGSPFEFVPETEPRGHKVPLDPEVLRAMHAYVAARLGAHGD